MPPHAEHLAGHVETLDTAAKPTTPDKSAVIAVYDTHVEAEEAVRALQKSGYDLKQLSIIGKDTKPKKRWSATTRPVTA